MAKKIRNFAAILAISAVVGTMLLVLVFLLPVGPMRRNVEKSVADLSVDLVPLPRKILLYDLDQCVLCRRMYDLDMLFLFLLRMFYTTQPSVTQINTFSLFTDDHVQSVLVMTGF